MVKLDLPHLVGSGLMAPAYQARFNTYNPEREYDTYVRPHGVLRHFAENNPLPFVKRTFNTMVGIEVEHEGFSFDTAQEAHIKPGLWRLHEDTSLRHGCEYVTPLGTRAYTVGQQLEILYGALEEHAEDRMEATFSERTSIHVHVNCRPVPWLYMPSILATYTVFEDVLFDFASRDRYNNIFTVPLCQSNRINKVFDNPRDDHPLAWLKTWQKYSALNLAPLFRMGTIEFRQMGGTWDWSRIIQWVLLCVCIRQYAQDVAIEDLRRQLFALKSESQYMTFAQKVFGSLAEVLSLSPSIDERVTDAKFFLKGL